MFLINSCLGHFSAAVWKLEVRCQMLELGSLFAAILSFEAFPMLPTSHLSLLTSKRHPFSRTYGVNLPSSLTTLLPLALGFSPHPPVSVCGTGTFILDRGFSRQCRIKRFGTYFPSPSRLRNILRICLQDYPFLLGEPFQQLARSISLRPLFSQTNNGGTGISTCCPSPTLFSLGLGPD